MRPRLRFLLSTCIAALAFNLLAPNLGAQITPWCSEPDYRIASTTVLLIHCTDDVSQITGIMSQLYKVDDAHPLAQLTIRPFPDARQWLIAEIVPGGSARAKLEAAGKYK